jgi:catalase
LVALADRLSVEGASPQFVAPRLGAVTSTDGSEIEADVSLAATASVLYDAMVLPDGADAVDELGADGRTLEFIKDQYRHCKSILAWGEGVHLLDACGIPTADLDPGLIIAPGSSDTPGDRFVEAIAKHRHFDRETDPPRV